MCYNQNYTSAFIILGLSSFIFIYKSNKDLSYIIFFYTIMETLQYIQYDYLNLCENNINYYSTIISHFLVCFQPFMWNLYRYRRNYKIK